MRELLIRERALTLALLTATLLAVAALAAPGFASARTAAIVTSNMLVLLLVSVGLFFVIVTRNIDVSGGSVLGLSAAVLGLSLQAGWPLWQGIVLCLLTGTAAGALNGALVTGLGVPSIVATLGTLGLFRGVMLVATDGEWIEALPEELKALASRSEAGLSVLAVVALAIAGLAWWFAARTRAGRDLYSIGDNREAARHLGLPVRRSEFLAFVAAGLCASVAGIVFAAQVGFVPNQAGTGVELRAIAVNVLGGVSLLGGSGSVAGVVVGTVFFTSIDSVLVFLRIPAYWNDLVGGAMLLAVLLFDGRLRIALDGRIRAQRYGLDGPMAGEPATASGRPGREGPAR